MSSHIIPSIPFIVPILIRPLKLFTKLLCFQQCLISEIQKKPCLISLSLTNQILPCKLKIILNLQPPCTSFFFFNCRGKVSLVGQKNQTPMGTDDFGPQVLTLPPISSQHISHHTPHPLVS